MTVVEGDTWHRGVDRIAVQRVVDGDRPLPVLQPQEQRVAFDLMARAGLSDREIAKRLGMAERTAVRWREAAADVVA